MNNAGEAMRDKEVRFPAPYAQRVAERLVQLLDPYCAKIQVAGSLRRARPDVHDIDLVIVPARLVCPEFGRPPKPGATMLDDGLNQLMAEHPNIKWWLNATGATSNGDKLKRLLIANPAHPRLDQLAVDLYLCTPETWATTLLIRTGSKEHNIMLCTRAAKLGGKLHANGEGLFNKFGNRIAGDTEDSIFSALGLPYVEPRLREVQRWAR